MFHHLRPYQQQHAEAALAIMNRRRTVLDASDMGTGKTYVAVALAKARGTVPLVIAPRSVLASWERVADRLGWPVALVNYERARGSRAKKGAQQKVNPKTGEVRRFALSDLGEEKPYGNGSFWRWKQEVEEAWFDEAHLCGGKTTLNSKMLIAAKRQFGNVGMLSGTAVEDPLDMKAIGYVLGLHNLKDYQDWLFDHGCRPHWAGGMVFGDPDDPEVGRGYLRLLHQEIFPERAVRMRKAEIPGFPKSQISVMMIDSTAEERKWLEEAEAERREYGGTVSDSASTLELSIVPKVVDLAANYEAYGPQVIFVNYRKTALRFHELLDCPIIWGEEGGEIERKLLERFGDRQQVIDHFQANKHPYVVATYGAGGPGINLHDPLGEMGRTTWELMTFDARMYSQATSRVWRDGGGFSNQFLIGLAGTYHESVLDVVADKLQRLEVFNDGDLLRGN